MKYMTTRHKQRGVTLVVGLIMLVLITLMVLSAFMLSSTNLKSVGNMQHRDESTAAANVAIEQVISTSAIFMAPASQTVAVGNYTVAVPAPVCLYATKVVTYNSADPNSNMYSEGTGGGTSPGYLDTYWDVAATVNDAMSGTSVETHQGIKITLPADPNPCP
ncbi:MAG: hypothetical protein V4713_15275 [Pseudomonadota bacterium]